MFEDLAFRLCCAYVSHQMGITYAHCEKTYMPRQRIGGYWLDLAEKVAREVGEGFADQMAAAAAIDLERSDEPEN
jgi:hypothetical protein